MAEVAKALQLVFNKLRLKNHNLNNKILREVINKKVVKTTLLNLIALYPACVGKIITTLIRT